MTSLRVLRQSAEIMVNFVNQLTIQKNDHSRDYPLPKGQ